MTLQVQQGGDQKADQKAGQQTAQKAGDQQAPDQKPVAPAPEYDFRDLEVPAGLDIVEVKDEAPTELGQLAGAIQAQQQQMAALVEQMTRGFQALGQALQGRPAPAAPSVPVEEEDDGLEAGQPAPKGQLAATLTPLLKAMHTRLKSLEAQNTQLRSEMASSLRNVEVGLRTETVQRDIAAAKAAVLAQLNLKALPGFTEQTIAERKYALGARATVQQAANLAASDALKIARDAGFVLKQERRPAAPEIPGSRDGRPRPTYTPPKLPETGDEFDAQLLEAMSVIGRAENGGQ
jgi:hypothetical protein